jgi:hypothetical protein
MDRTTLGKVCEKVYRRFPIVAGKKPKVTTQGSDRYLLVFSSSGKTPDGKTIQQSIRVVTTADGRIIKTSMSR